VPATFKTKTLLDVCLLAGMVSTVWAGTGPGLMPQVLTSMATTGRATPRQVDTANVMLTSTK
jgi:hypothetical protein